MLQNREFDPCKVKALPPKNKKEPFEGSVLKVFERTYWRVIIKTRTPRSAHKRAERGTLEMDQAKTRNGQTQNGFFLIGRFATKQQRANNNPPKTSSNTKATMKTRKRLETN